MYSTCIFCNSPLGSNEIIEEFPVGRRIAFDSAVGRLWVVCRACERWNLSPLDERWEIIEQCERRYSETRLRVSTENIGLARLSEGLELVRVGKPMRPELAAWRYGDQFGRRRRRYIITTGAGLAGLGVLLAGSWAIGVGLSFAPNLTSAVSGAIDAKRNKQVIARPVINGTPVDIRRGQIQKMRLWHRSDGWSIEVRDKKGSVEVMGQDAQLVLARAMPHINRSGGSQKTVREAVSLLERAGNPETFFSETAVQAQRRYINDLHKQPYAVRLALEMAAHEDSERRALEGELKDLERAWKEAEEIAAISDSLFTPRAILDKIERWRKS